MSAAASLNQVARAARQNSGMRTAGARHPHDLRDAPREVCADVTLVRLIGRQLVCLVTNRSDLGMRLRFGAPPVLDPRFVVEDALTKASTAVRLVWLNDSEAGVCIERDCRDRSSYDAGW